MPARKPRRRADPSPSSSSDEEGGSQQLDEQRYACLQLAAALRRPADFASAATELSLLIKELYGGGRSTKQAQAAMAQDAALAIECCDSRLQSRAALAALMEAAERHLPQARRNALLRQYRQSSVQLRRRERRRGGTGAGGSAGAEGGEEEEEEGEAPPPADFAALPVDVARHVFRYLDPITLARAACVCHEWRDSAADDSLWQPHWQALAAVGRPGRRGPHRGSLGQPAGSNRIAGGAAQQHKEGERGSRSSSNRGGSEAQSCRQLFVAEAAQQPDRLLRWKTNRVLVGRRLAWLDPASRQLQQQQYQRQQVPRYRHLDAASVVAFCRSGGRHAGEGGSGSSGDDSSSEGGEGSGGEADGASRRLRFWQL